MRLPPAALLLLLVLLAGFVVPVGHVPEALPSPPSRALVKLNGGPSVAGGGGRRLPESNSLGAADAAAAEVTSTALVEVGAAARGGELVPISRSGGRALLESDPGIGRSLVVHENGTVELVDSRSWSTVWQLPTGSPLSSLEQGIYPSGDWEYFIYPGDGSDLNVLIKGVGVMKHPLTIEQYIAGPPEIRGSVVTVGSKTSTVYMVNADSGEIIYKHSLPANLSGSKVSVTKEKPLLSKLDAGKNDRNANYITIIRTDYSLSSSDLGKHLWNWTRSYFSAYNHAAYEHRPVMNGMVEPSLHRGNIPIRVLRRRDKLTSITSKDRTAALHHGGVVLNSAALDSSIEVNDVAMNVYNGVNPYLEQANPNSLISSVDSSNSTNDGLVKDNAHLKLLLASLLILAMACLIYLREPVKYVRQLMEPVTYDKKLTEFKSKPDATPKKRRGRKKDGIVNSPERLSSSEKENTETDGLREYPFKGKYSLMKSIQPADAGDGRWVGKLFVSNVEIGRGSNGTVVLEGFYDGRPVAVKRLLHAHHDVALKEIQNLIASDQHPNIVRLYGVEQDYDFVYISLERCSCSLADLIQWCSDLSLKDSTSVHDTVIRIQSNRLERNLELWRSDGLPSVQLLKLMRDVVSGLVHLHELGIIHRDMKPQNVLISTEGSVRAKLSDMGISKRLQEDMSSLSRHATGFGSSGWQAPEQLLHGRQTRALDLFSLGCILFYCITKGKHPFGEYFERDMNIINNRFDLFVVDYIPEAVHLLSQLLYPDPVMRPRAVEVLHHPLFWSSELRISFLRDSSDRIDKANETDLLNALESIGPVAFGGKWGEKLDAALIADMGRYRKYNFESTRDLLRLIRNKSGHYRELPADLQEALGSLPEGFDRYFSSRFPKLLIEVYKVICVYCKEEEFLGKYFRRSLV